MCHVVDMDRECPVCAGLAALIDCEVRLKYSPRAGPGQVDRRPPSKRPGRRDCAILPDGFAGVACENTINGMCLVHEASFSLLCSKDLPAGLH